MGTISNPKRRDFWKSVKMKMIEGYEDDDDVLSFWKWEDADDDEDEDEDEHEN